MKNLSPQIKSINEIVKEWKYSKEAIKNRLEGDIAYLNLDESHRSSNLFLYATKSEALRFKEYFEIEIDYKFTLELVAAFEAKLIYYFKNLIKRKSDIHQCFAHLISNKIRRGISRLTYSHILLIFKSVIYPNDHILYSSFKNLIALRNWLAHGRGWEVDNQLRKFDFEYSLLTIEKVIHILPGFPQALR